jgi:elongation factor Ts
MADVTAAMVKELRERTGLGMMDCKKALTEAQGDMDRAIEDLRRSSALKAAKKAGRTAADGLLGVRVAPDGARAAMVEVNIETDFAARNEKFTAFVDRAVGRVFDSGNADVAALLAGGLDAEREALVQEIGENVSVRRAAVLKGGRVSCYLHADKKKGALVALDGGDDELGREIAMHVVAINPMVVEASQLPADVVAKERENFTAQASESGKPADIVAKMVEGRVRKFLAESSLVEQPFVKDANVKVGKLLADRKARCTGFVRFEVGEGIDKVETDFAAEVAAQVKGRG